MDNESDSSTSSTIVIWVFIGWMILSCLSGWILSFLFYPPDLIWTMYLDYANFIYYYDLFCLAIISSIFLMPLAFFFSWKGLWQSINIISNPSKSRIFVFSILTPIISLPGLGFLFVSDNRGAIFHIFLDLLTFLFDWIGGVIFCISFFITSFWLIALTAKSIKLIKEF